MTIQNLQDVIQTASKCLAKLQAERTKKIDPLIDDRALKMRLYGIDNLFFDSIDKLENYCLENNLPLDNFYVLDYMNYLAERTDVIRKIDSDGIVALYTLIDEEGYGKYQPIKSQERKRPVWEYHEGSIEWMYQPFKERNMKVKNDIYEKENKRNQYIIKRIQKNKSANKQ